MGSLQELCKVWASSRLIYASKVVVVFIKMRFYCMHCALLTAFKLCMHFINSMTRDFYKTKNRIHRQCAGKEKHCIMSCMMHFYFARWYDENILYIAYPLKTLHKGRENVSMRKERWKNFERRAILDEGLPAHSHCAWRAGLALLVPEFYAFSLLTGWKEVVVARLSLHDKKHIVL